MIRPSIEETYYYRFQDKKCIHIWESEILIYLYGMSRNLNPLYGKQNKGGRLMGKKDEYQFDYLDDNRRFADQINGALFHGRQVVKPEELEPDETQIVSTGEKNGSVKTIVDKVRIWKGKKLHILVVENQNYVDYQMVFRNMLSESIGYRRQWKRRKRAHREAKDLKNRDEYLSGMKKGEKFAPIITLVVFFGTDGAWDGAKCLYDLLEIDDELKEYVSNYRLNLYDCHEHDTFEEYKTGLRQVFEIVRYAEDKEKLQEIIEENREMYSRIDSETRDMLEVVANVKIPEECRVMEIGEERYNMYNAFEQLKQDAYEEGIAQGIEDGIKKGIEEGIEKGIEQGIEQGIEKGIRILIQAYQELGMSQDVIMVKCAEKYGITEESAREYVEAHCVF